MVDRMDWRGEHMRWWRWLDDGVGKGMRDRAIAIMVERRLTDKGLCCGIGREMHEGKGLR